MLLTYRLFGDKPPQQIDKKESENLATLVEAIGFGIAPDVRFHDLKLNPDGKVVVFPNGYGADFRPSAVFLTLVTIIRLGALVSQTDDVLSDEEKAILQNLINETGELTQSERDSLHAFLQWCLDTPKGQLGSSSGYLKPTQQKRRQLAVYWSQLLSRMEQSIRQKSCIWKSLHDYWPRQGAS